MTEKEGKADAQPFHLILLAKDLDGLPEPLPARHGRPRRRLLLPAADRPRAPRPPRRGARRAVAPVSAARSRARSRSTTGTGARRLAGEYRDILGEGNFFLELQDHGLPEQRVLNEKLLRLAPETGIPLVVTNDLHYVHQRQSEAHDVLLCVGTGNNIDTPGRMKFETDDFWLKSAAQMAALFPDQPEAILNSRRIAEMTDLELPLGQLRIPHFPVPDGETVETWLRKECERGLARALRDGDRRSSRSDWTTSSA